MALNDNEFSIGGLVMGPGTSYLVQTVEGLGMPDVRSSDVDKPRSHGAFYGLDFLGSRALTLNVLITTGNTGDEAVDAAEAHKALSVLAGIWQPISYNTTTVQPLTYKLPYHDERIINGRPRRSHVDYTNVGNGLITVTLQYVAADPRVYASNLSSVAAVLPVVTGGLAFPLAFPLSFGASSSGVAVANNAGNFATHPIVRLVGPLTNPVLENVTTGKRLALTTDIPDGQYVDVNMDDRTVLLNGTASRYGDLTSSSTWWDVVPGNNIFRLSAGGGTGIATVTFQSAWL